VRPAQRDLEAIMLIAAPFVGAGGWPGDEFELPADLGSTLPQGVPVRSVCRTSDVHVVPAP
jgi:hypothetical protein